LEEEFCEDKKARKEKEKKRKKITLITDLGTHSHVW
jgi:hypothetical protein